MVKWDDVKEDYAKKDAEIEELKSKLKEQRKNDFAYIEKYLVDNYLHRFYKIGVRLPEKEIEQIMTDILNEIGNT
jgi:hypothetical protein